MMLHAAGIQITISVVATLIAAAILYGIRKVSKWGGKVLDALGEMSGLEKRVTELETDTHQLSIIQIGQGDTLQRHDRRITKLEEVKP